MTRPPEPASSGPPGRSLRGLLRGVPAGVLLREGGLAALPGVTALALLALAYLPTSQTLADDGRRNLYAYQGLLAEVHAYEVLSLTPGVSAQALRAGRETALSSAANPAQFTALEAVQRNEYGPARLAQVEAYLRQDSVQSRRAASLEALRLQAQADRYAQDLSTRAGAALTRLRRALIATALVTGVLSLLLTLRALLLWRAERQRHLRREARQREALRLASHELRRPLQTLLLASDLLRHADTPGGQQKLLSMIEDSATQLAARADLTRLNDLYLDVTLRPQPTDLGALLRRFASTRVEVHTPEAPLVWPADPDRVRQIVENLVENALRYTLGPVEVDLALADGRPRLEVRDHGPGLDAELLERVFLPYERGPQGLRQGHGLGLPLVRRYARAHGGDVTLRAAPAGGLTATVTLGEPVRGGDGEWAVPGRTPRP